MPHTDNSDLIKQIYAAFGRGDIVFVLNALSSDVVFDHPQPGDIPWGGTWRGKEQAAAFFGALAGAVDVERFEPREFVCQNDRVVVLGWERMRTKAAGRHFETKWVHAWTVRDGKVTKFEDHVDTAAIVAALRPK